MQFDAVAVAKFFSRVNKNGPIPKEGFSPCWIWTGCMHKSGHGQTQFQGMGVQYTHRLSWQIANGNIPPGMCVCHTCDVPACCNPRHMFLGTRSDNMRDMWAKARGVHNDNAARCLESRRRQLAMSDSEIVATVIEPFAAGESVKSICAATGLGPQSVRGLIAGRTRRCEGVTDERYAELAHDLVHHKARIAKRRHAA